MKTAEELDSDRKVILYLLDHPQSANPANVTEAQVRALVYIGDAVRDLADSTYTAAQGAFGSRV